MDKLEALKQRTFEHKLLLFARDMDCGALSHFPAQVRNIKT